MFRSDLDEAPKTARGKPVTADAVQAIPSRQLDDPEPKLARHGYKVRKLAKRFKPTVAQPSGARKRP
jgi:hypothetical protein